MFNKKKISLIILTMVLSASTTPLAFGDENTNDDVQEIAVHNENIKSKNLEDLSIQQLIEIRDKDIDQNLEYLKELGANTTQDIQDRKDEILNSEWGIVAFFNKNYTNLTEKDKLIKQIKLIEYLNSIKAIMYPAGDYFNVVYQDYQLSEYLLQNGKDSNTISYENLKFLINNVEDASDFVDYDAKDVVRNIDPSIKTELSQDQKTSLNNELKEISLDNNVNTEIKNEIKELQDELNIEKSKPNQISLRANSSSYRKNALNYARKHGYTNGYYGSTDKNNNAPSPYYNFQKDGYGDCANFVSQCLYAGGVTFWKGDNPWYYYSTSNRSASWAGARQFKEHWEKRVDCKTLTVSKSGNLSFLKPATPISICTPNGVATHTLISTDQHSNGSNFSYAAHSDGGTRSNLSSKLSGQKITYYKVHW